MPTGIYKRTKEHKLIYLRNLGRYCKKGNKLSKETKIRMGERQIGEKNHRWSGEMVGYKGIHKWLIINFGKANKCENPECSCKEPEKFEWSLINGMEYERKRDNFWMLCTSCHKTYDGIINNIKKMNNYEKV